MKQSGKSEKRLSRRVFLSRSALASLGMGLFPLTSRAQRLPQAGVEVRRYVPLGNTGMKMSDISFGGSRSARLLQGNNPIPKLASAPRHRSVRRLSLTAFPGCFICSLLP